MVTGLSRAPAAAHNAVKRLREINRAPRPCG